MLTFNGIFGKTGLWDISIFSFKVSQVFWNFLHEHVVYLKSEDCHPKMSESRRNETKALEMFYGLWEIYAYTYASTPHEPRWAHVIREFFP